MGKTCYKNMEVSAYGTTQYATSVTFNETATLEAVPVMGGGNTAQVMTNEPKGTMQFNSVMTSASQVSSLTGRIGKASKAGGAGASAPQTLKAGALECPLDNQMTNMSVSAEAGGTIQISSTASFAGQTDFGGTPSVPSTAKIYPLVAANISGTMTPYTKDGGMGAPIELSGMQSFSYTASQSFKEEKKIGSTTPTVKMGDGSITLEISSDAAAINYDIVRITGASGLCGENGEDTRTLWFYSIDIQDCSGISIYDISDSGVLEGRGTSASPEGITKTNMTFVTRIPNDVFPDQTEDCA